MTELVYQIYRKPGEFKRKMESRIKEEIENIKRQVDAELVFECTDYCLKEGPFYSLWVYKELIFPFLNMLGDAAHKKGIFFVKHTDGNIWPIIDDLIATGIDALHSIDPGAGMSLSEVKEKYGESRIVRECRCGFHDSLWKSRTGGEGGKTMYKGRGGWRRILPDDQQLHP